MFSFLGFLENEPAVKSLESQAFLASNPKTIVPHKLEYHSGKFTTDTMIPKAPKIGKIIKLKMITKTRVHRIQGIAPDTKNDLLLSRDCCSESREFRLIFLSLDFSSFLSVDDETVFTASLSSGMIVKMFKKLHFPSIIMNKFRHSLICFKKE